MRTKNAGRAQARNRWHAMIARCTDANDHRWQYYGGRGIKVCDRWLASFEDYYADTGDQPAPGLTLDRRDNDGNYEPSNMRWATAKEQRANSRDFNLAKTHCPRNHPYDVIDNTGRRRCRACRREQWAAKQLARAS